MEPALTLSAMKMTPCPDAIPDHLFARDLNREIRLAVTAKHDSGERNALFAAGLVFPHRIRCAGARRQALPERRIRPKIAR